MKPDSNLWAIRQARAKNRLQGNDGFLHHEAARIIGERLEVTKRDFSAPALFFDDPFAKANSATLQASSNRVFENTKLVERPDNQEAVLDIEPESIDLAISIFGLNRMAKIGNLLFQINMALKPDGLFSAAMLADGSLAELKAVLLEAELDIRQGASPRIGSFPQVRQLGDIMQQTGFKLPVIDLEQTIIHYSSFEKIISDLRDCGANGAPDLTSDGKNTALDRRILRRARELYQEKYSSHDGKLRVTINMAFLSGWKAHESQQRPAKRGSAKHPLLAFPEVQK